MTVVSEIQIICLCRVFGGKRVDLLDRGENAKSFSLLANLCFFRPLQVGDLAVRKTGLLCLKHQSG